MKYVLALLLLTFAVAPMAVQVTGNLNVASVEKAPPFNDEGPGDKAPPFNDEGPGGGKG